MGGIGSGRHGATTTKVEEVIRIDIRWLKKTGRLAPNTGGMLIWNVNGRPNGEIGYTMYADRMVLDYRTRKPGGEWSPRTQTIPITTTPCHFGGERKWFQCPSCARRVAILCSPAGHFHCRKCCHLAYWSQSESEIERMQRKLRKIKARLYDDSGRRPKGMHWRTFKQRSDEHNALDEAVDFFVYEKLRPFFTKKAAH